MEMVTKLKNRNMILTVVDFDIQAVGDDWESLVGAGQTVAAAHDNNRWVMGDLGLKVAKKYGEDRLGSWASEIGQIPTTVYDYVACSGFYNHDDRAAFPTLTWSHYRAAKAIGDHDAAMVWLARAADAYPVWTVSQLGDAVKNDDPNPAPPNRLILKAAAEFIECVPFKTQRDADDFEQDEEAPQDYIVTFRLTKPIELRHIPYTLKVFGIPDEADE